MSMNRIECKKNEIRLFMMLVCLILWLLQNRIIILADESVSDLPAIEESADPQEEIVLMDTAEIATFYDAETESIQIPEVTDTPAEQVFSALLDENEEPVIVEVEEVVEVIESSGEESDHFSPVSEVHNPTGSGTESEMSVTITWDVLQTAEIACQNFYHWDAESLCYIFDVECSGLAAVPDLNSTIMQITITNHSDSVVIYDVVYTGDPESGITTEAVAGTGEGFTVATSSTAVHPVEVQITNVSKEIDPQNESTFNLGTCSFILR